MLGIKQAERLQSTTKVISYAPLITSLGQLNSIDESNKHLAYKAETMLDDFGADQQSSEPS
jgi:hypothetical protein